jgi:hypothetical protein
VATSARHSLTTTQPNRSGQGALTGALPFFLSIVADSRCRPCRPDIRQADANGFPIDGGFVGHRSERYDCRSYCEIAWADNGKVCPRLSTYQHLTPARLLFLPPGDEMRGKAPSGLPHFVSSLHAPIIPPAKCKQIVASRLIFWITDRCDRRIEARLTSCVFVRPRSGRKHACKGAPPPLTPGRTIYRV